MRANRQDGDQQVEVKSEYKAPEVGLEKLEFDFPTRPEGKFAQAMSSVACNPVSGAKGCVPNI